jgi:ATP-dependent protease HslVU (ClpYQ) peptidase subunit
MYIRLMHVMRLTQIQKSLQILKHWNRDKYLRILQQAVSISDTQTTITNLSDYANSCFWQRLPFVFLV